MDKSLLKILVCPETHTPLREADASLVRRLNQQALRGVLKNKSGKKIECQLDGGLIRQDNAVLYPIVDGLPILLVDEAILLDQAESNRD